MAWITTWPSSARAPVSLPVPARPCIPVPARATLQQAGSLPRTLRQCRFSPFHGSGDGEFPPCVAAVRRLPLRRKLQAVGRQTPMKNLSFDIGSPDDYNNFRQFINKMRTELRAPDVEKIYHVPVLPVVGNQPGFMDLTLSADDNTQIILRLRTDTLYVIGFCNGRGSWFEFRGGHAGKMIEGSATLPFKETYLSGGMGSLSTDDAILGRIPVENAIRGLARHDEEEAKKEKQYELTKYWLKTLIVNFIESVRLESIADRVDGEMRNPSYDVIANRQLRSQDLLDIGNWGGLSQAFVSAVSNPMAGPSSVFRDVYFVRREIRNVADAAALLGMALVAPSRPTSGRGSSHRPRRDDDVESGAIIRGIVLAEVIELSVVEIDGYNPGKLYGMISITDSAGRTHQLYNRNSRNTQLVGPGGLADLDWPPRPISGADDFFINVDLKDNYAYRPWPDPAVACGVVAWNSREALAGDYNSIITAEVKQDGEQGSNSVLMKYAVLTDAVVATVKITVADSGEWFDLDIYGDVTAEIRMPSGKPLMYKLFSKNRSNDVDVEKRTRAIGLHRNSVSVPLSSSFVVHAELWDAKIFGDDTKIADGVASFTPHHNGSNSAKITDQNDTDGKVSVEVTWSF